MTPDSIEIIVELLDDLIFIGVGALIAVPLLAIWSQLNKLTMAVYDLTAAMREKKK